MNTQKILNAVKYFEEEPLRLNMGNWIRHIPKGQTGAPPCGTVACLAGSAIIAEAKSQGISISALIEQSGSEFELPEKDLAMQIFGIDAVQAKLLFYTQDWPDVYNHQYSLLEKMLYDFPENINVIKLVKKYMVRILKSRVNCFIYSDGKE